MPKTFKIPILPLDKPKVGCATHFVGKLSETVAFLFKCGISQNMFMTYPREENWRYSEDNQFRVKILVTPKIGIYNTTVEKIN